ncbi:MAG: hypothetical protein ACREMY_15975, partial [bacterium]
MTGFTPGSRTSFPNPQRRRPYGAGETVGGRHVLGLKAQALRNCPYGAGVGIRRSANWGATAHDSFRQFQGANLE